MLFRERDKGCTNLRSISTALVNENEKVQAFERVVGFWDVEEVAKSVVGDASPCWGISQIAQGLCYSGVNVFNALNGHFLGYREGQMVTRQPRKLENHCGSRISLSW